METDISSQTAGRSRRVKEDKFGRLAAFQKLKSLKGTKHKYEVVEEKPVYDEVSEKEYSRVIQERQEDDWIIDDNGIGYVEDGREIFDDDIEEDIYTDKKCKQAPKKNLSGPQKKTPKSIDIKSMFKPLPVKRKIENDGKLEDDDILSNIMEDLHKEANFHAAPKPMVLNKKHKLNHHSPVQRFNPNPFVKNTSPLAANFVPKDLNNAKSSPNIHRKHMQPKVVNFENIQDNVNDVEVTIQQSAKEVEEETAVNEPLASADLKHNKTEVNGSQNSIKDIDDDLKFDPSCDLFDDIDTECQADISSQVTDNFSPSVEETQSAMPTFRGSLNSEAKDNVIVDIQVDSGHLPLVLNEEGQQVLRFFWLDAYEDQYKQPGTVYFFGKVYIQDQKSYTSCCIIVKEVPRRVFFLPRETHFDMKTKACSDKPVTMPDVYSEVNALLEKMKISEFRSKKSQKHYAFGSSEIPDTCEYLEVHYNAKYPPLPSSLYGSTFSHVLGADSTSIELLLLEQKIKGPCWLDVHVPQLSVPPVSWCKIEAFVTKVKNLVCSNESLPTPPVTLMCMNLTTSLNSKTQQNEIVAVSCLSHQQFPLDKTAPLPKYQNHFCVLTKPNDGIFPYDFKDAIMNYNNTKVERVDSERSLLIYFLAKLHKMDPDVIVGHDILGFDLDVLLHRLSVHKIPNWSRIGRLRRAGMPRLNIAQGGIAEKNATCGRLLCDIKISSKELIRCKSYDLEELAKYLLNQEFCEIPPECVLSQYTSSKHLIQLIDFSMRRAELILNINCELNILPLALQITNIAGCIMSRTLLGGRSERNEYLLLHAFNAKNFIPPPKVQGKKQQKNQTEDDELETVGKKGRRKPAYEGGLVLDPKKGFYDKFILLMDFNSLYPSIIQEYNICFTTIPRVPDSESNSEENIQVCLPEPGIETGILPSEIRKLVESRRQVKQMMKANDITKERYAQYDIRQRALKLTANSMYGCLGFSFSRFYAKPIAALITRKGREILLKTKELVEKMGLDVIYGDTDSIMINTNQTNLNDVSQLGNKVKAEINKLYRLLEIDIDGMYKPMLLLKKKKYAALSISKSSDGKIIAKEEIKGLDIVRRDWSQLAKDAGQFIIKEILSDKSKDDIVENIHAHLLNLGSAVKEGRKHLSDYIIYKQLTKNPEEYSNKKNLPHVLVACRMNDKSGKKLKMGDTVAYIICTDGSDLAATQRAYHPDELKSREDLKIDVFYYLAQQIHPVVSRLCEPIEGTDSSMIAQLLGLDASKYHASVQDRDDDEDDKLLNPSSLFDDKDRFKNCDKLKLTCPSTKCRSEIIIDDTFRNEGSSIVCQLESCSKCKSRMEHYSGVLSNKLRRIMKQFIKKFYQRNWICEDVGCAYETGKLKLQLNSGGPICPSCKNSNLRLEYTEAQLYNQLAYFQRIFDIEKAKSVLTKEEADFIKVSPETEKLYQILKTLVEDKALNRNAYGIVNLNSLFQRLYMKDPDHIPRST